MEREALKLALEALRMADELCRGHGVDFKEYGLEFDKDIQVKYREAITAIKEALAQPAQEPVAHFGSAYVNENGVHITTVLGPVAIPQDAKLYTTPPQRPWVGLTDEETQAYWDWEDWQTGAGRSTIFEMVRDIETKLKEKNNGL